MRKTSLVRAASLLLCSLLSVSQAQEQAAPTVGSTAKPTTLPHAPDPPPTPIEKSPLAESAKQTEKVISWSAAKPVTKAERKYPAEVSVYDYMTAEDEFIYHHLEKLCQGSDIANWPLVKSMLELGLDGIDAGIIAGMANETIYISDQPRAAPIMKMVQECAEILQMEAPPVHIKGDPYPNAWVTGFRDPHVMVMTSGLLQLYQDSPEELRFIIGHELGHLKSKHLRTGFLARVLLGTILRSQAGKSELRQDLVLMFSLGSLLQWSREAEFSADRAGMICVGGDVNVAQQALLRLLHQTRDTNKLFDPKHPKFEPRLALRHTFDLRERPLVDVISWLGQVSLSHPFVPDRCIALDEWAHSGQYQKLLVRPKRAHTKSSVVVTKITVKSLPDTDTYVPLVDGRAADPQVTLSHAGKILKTGYLNDRKDAEWSGIEMRFPLELGAGLIVEVHDYNSVTASGLIGSVRLPVDPFAGQKGVAKADLRMDINSKSTIVERPIVTIEYRVDDHE